MIAGAVVYRRNLEGAVEFLLVRSHSSRWIFPKGHVEPGETLAAALREVKEEAGVAALVCPADLGTLENVRQGRMETLHLFLAEYVATAGEPGRGRSPVWMAPMIAREALTGGRTPLEAAPWLAALARAEEALSRQEAPR